MQPSDQQREVEVRLGKSFLKYFGGENVADKYPDAPEYSLFYCLFFLLTHPSLRSAHTHISDDHLYATTDTFKPDYINEESYGVLTEKDDQKVVVDYQCPRDDTSCSFSGTWRRGEDTECLLVYDAAEQCYVLEKLGTAYEGLKRREKRPGALPAAGGLVPPEHPAASASPAAPAAPAAPLLPPPPTTAPLVLNVPEPSPAATSASATAAAEPAPAKKRQRRTRAPKAAADGATAAADGDTPPKKPRKKRVTKKEREAAAAAAA